MATLAGAFLLWPFSMHFRSEVPILFNTMAADTYYYAAMARNFTQFGFFGIDGQTASNGFMPLWQMVVAALDLTVAGSDTPPMQLLTAILVASIVLMAVGVALLARFVTRCFGAPFALLTLPLICPGAAYFAFEHPFHQFQQIGLHSGHGMWSFANGMESALGLVLFAIFLPVALRTLDPTTVSHRSAFLAGGLAFLIMMARLDDVFLGIAFGLCLLPLAMRLRDPQLVLRMAMLPLIGTALYLGINILTVGHPLPTSGMLKTQAFSFPNGLDELAALGKIQRIDTRLLPLVAALLIGILGLLSQARKSARNWDTQLILMLSLYLILKAGFLISSVPLHEQGYWYLTNIIAALNLLVVIGLGRIVSVTLSARTAVLAAPVLLLVTGTAAENTATQLTRYRDDSYTTVSRDLCTDPSPILAALDDGPIIDTADGVFAFCLGRPAVTLTGLADSAAFIEERNRLGFFPASLAHGHAVLIESPWGSYDWRGQLADHKATLLVEHKNVRAWKIAPPE